MKEKFRAVKSVLSYLLMLAIFVTMPFILIERTPQTANVSIVWSELYDHGLTPSEAVEALAQMDDPNLSSGYTLFPPDGIAAVENEKRMTEDIVRGVNGVPQVEYSEDDLYWLSRIIYAEAGTEPFEGMVAVGSVVMNRVASENYPDTVYGVIFDRKFGVQFTPAATGTVYRTPSEKAITAAKLCLCGYSVSDEILFFLNEKFATSTWTRDNCEYMMTIGNHDFYA